MKALKPQRILIVTERFFPEEFIINELATELGRDVAITVLTQNPSYPFDKPFPGYNNPLISIRRWRGIKVVRGLTILGYKRNLILKLLNYIWFAFYNSLLALFVAPGHDRIFVFHTGPLTLAIPAALAARVYRIPMSVWTQDVWPDSVFAYGFSKRKILEYALGEFVRWVYRRANTVLISCEGFRASVRRFAPRSRLVYAPNWSTYQPIAEGSVTKTRESTEFSIMFAGNVGKVQNLELVIQAFAAIEMSYPQLRLEIVGDGSNLQTLRTLAYSLGCRQVIFHGRVPVDSMAAYYQRVDALIISLIKRPIFALTVPSKFQSYLAAGKPILAVIEGEVARIVREKQLGVVAVPDQVESIRQAMIDLYNMDQAERQNICKRAKNLLDSDYNRNTVIANIRDVIYSSN